MMAASILRHIIIVYLILAGFAISAEAQTTVQNEPSSVGKSHNQKQQGGNVAAAEAMRVDSTKVSEEDEDEVDNPFAMNLDPLQRYHYWFPGARFAACLVGAVSCKLWLFPPSDQPSELAGDFFGLQFVSLGALDVYRLIKIYKHNRSLSLDDSLINKKQISQKLNQFVNRYRKIRSAIFGRDSEPAKVAENSRDGRNSPNDYIPMKGIQGFSTELKLGPFSFTHQLTLRASETPQLVTPVQPPSYTVEPLPKQEEAAIAVADRQLKNPNNNARVDAPLDVQFPASKVSGLVGEFNLQQLSC